MACTSTSFTCGSTGHQTINSVQFPLPQVGSTKGSLTWEIPKLPIGLNPSWGRADLDLHKERKTYRWILKPLTWAQVEALFVWWAANRGKKITMSDECGAEIPGMVVANPVAKLIHWGNVPSCDNNGSVWQIELTYEADTAATSGAVALELPEAIDFEPDVVIMGQPIRQTSGQTVMLDLKCKWTRTINADVVTMKYGQPTLVFTYDLLFQTKEEVDLFFTNVVALQGNAAVPLVDQYWGERDVIFQEMPVTIAWTSLNRKTLTLSFQEVY